MKLPPSTADSLQRRDLETKPPAASKTLNGPPQVSAFSQGCKTATLSCTLVSTVQRNTLVLLLSY